MTDWLTNMSIASYDDIQTKWNAHPNNDPTKASRLDEYFQAGAYTQFAGLEDPVNAWMWKNHPMIAYLDIPVWGKHMYVCGKNVAIGSSIAALMLYVIVLK